MSRRRVTRSKPRVVHVTTTDMSLDWLLAPQLKAFKAAGYEIIGLSAAGPHVTHLEEMGIEHVNVPAFTRSSNPLQDVRAFMELTRTLRSLRPDIVHTHNPKPGILGRIAARLIRTPLVVNTQHGLWAQATDRWQRRLPVYAAERIAAAFGDIELVQNPEDVRTLVETLHIPAHKVTLLGNGVDLSRFDPTIVGADSRAQLRTEWRIDDSEVVCVVVGRLVIEKGIVELLDAAHQLHERGVPARFVIIGPTDPDKSDAIDPAIFERSRADGVVMTGTRTDMPECYAAADIFITASWREGFPRGAMEAAAMGLPTVASDIRGNRQVIADGETGLLVPVRDAARIGDAVERLVGDADERSKMSVAARQRAAAEFDQQRVIDRTLDAYASVRVS
jgi:glycosyltransferase involved in cell wall biosynthesis